MAVEDLPEDIEEDTQDLQKNNVGLHRSAWQFAKMVVVLGLVIGLIALVTQLPKMGTQPEKIDSNGLVQKSATDVCSAYQGVAHSVFSTVCCAAACGQFCGSVDCQDGPPGYKACCASAIELDHYCGPDSMAPCRVTTTTTPAPPPPPTTTPPPLEILKGRMVVSTKTGEGALLAARAGGTDNLACRQAITVALGLSQGAVYVKKVSVRSSGDNWTGGGIFTIDYEILAVKGSPALALLSAPPLSQEIDLRKKLVAQLQSAFTDVNIATVVTDVSLPHPSSSVV